MQITQITQKQISTGVVVTIAVVAFFLFGNSTSQEAAFNGDNNTQSVDNSVEIDSNVDLSEDIIQEQENTQDSDQEQNLNITL